MTRPTRKLLHTSDIHVGSNEHSGTQRDKGLEGLERVLELALRQGVDLLLIAGDLFDHSRVKSETVAAVAERLAQCDLRTVILPGNHDIAAPGGVYARTSAPFPSNVHVLGDGGGETLRLRELDIQVWGRAHVSYDDHAPLDPGPQWIADSLDRPHWRVALAHGFYYTGRGDRARSYLIHDEHLTAASADYIALGHLDLHAKVGPPGTMAYYPGAPEYTAGATLVVLEESAIQVTQVKFES